MKKKLFSLLSWLNRSLDSSTAIGIATYADTVNAVCLKKNQGQWYVHNSHSVNVEDQTDYTVAIATCTNEVCMIGDCFKKDIFGATSLGIDTIWFNHEKKQESYTQTSIKQVNTFKEILELV